MVALRDEFPMYTLCIAEAYPHEVLQASCRCCVELAATQEITAEILICYGYGTEMCSNLFQNKFPNLTLVCVTWPAQSFNHCEIFPLHFRTQAKKTSMYCNLLFKHAFNCLCLPYCVCFQGSLTVSPLTPRTPGSSKVLNRHNLDIQFSSILLGGRSGKRPSLSNVYLKFLFKTIVI